MDAPEAPHQLLERQRPARGVERHHLAVQDERPGRQLAPRDLDDVGQAPRDVAEAPGPDGDAVAVLVELDARAVVLVLERRAAAVRGERLVEVGGQLGEHGQERHAHARGRRLQGGRPAVGGEHGDGGEVAEEEEGAAGDRERRAGHQSDRLEHEALGGARAQLAGDDPREDLALARRGAHGENGEARLARPAGAAAAGVGHPGERGGHVGEGERRAEASALRRREPAHAEGARVRHGQRAARQERHRVADGVGRQAPEVLREQGELVEPPARGLEPAGQLDEPGEIAHPVILRFLTWREPAPYLRDMRRRVFYDASSGAGR